jgi:hypothetical protein
MASWFSVTFPSLSPLLIVTTGASQSSNSHGTKRRADTLDNPSSESIPPASPSTSTSMESSRNDRKESKTDMIKRLRAHAQSLTNQINDVVAARSYGYAQSSPLSTSTSLSAIVLSTSPSSAATHWAQTLFMFDNDANGHHVDVNDDISGHITISNNNKNYRLCDVQMTYRIVNKASSQSSSPSLTRVNSGHVHDRHYTLR